jgi:hypothetical protein
MRRLALLIGVLVVMRWLMVAGGPQTFDPPAAPPPAVFDLTSSPHGGWTEVQDPKAYYDSSNNRTYLSWVNSSDGGAYVQAWDHSTEALIGSPFLIADYGGPDLHNAPAVVVRESDGRVIVVASGHSTASIFMKISTNPHDVTAFGSAVNIDSQLGGGDYTYPVLYQLRGVTNSPIYLLWRDIVSDQQGRIAYSILLDNGATTWSTRTLIFTCPTNNTPYWRIGSDWDSRIDIVTTDIEPDDSTGLWHFYLDGTDNSLHESDGTTIAAGLPLEVTDLTPVMDDTNGSMMGWGIAYDGANPASVVMQHPVGASTDNAIRMARWTGSAWTVETVVSSVGGLLNGNTYASGVVVPPDDPDTVYVPIKTAGKFEIFRYTKAGSWTAQQLTTGGVDQWEPAAIFPVGPPELRVMWLKGTYTSDTNWSTGITGSD